MSVKSCPIGPSALAISLPPTSSSSAIFGCLPLDVQLLIFKLLGPRGLCNLTLATKNFGQLTAKHFADEWKYLYFKKYAKYGIPENSECDFKRLYLDTVNLPQRIAQAGVALLTLSDNVSLATDDGETEKVIWTRGLITSDNINWVVEKRFGHAIKFTRGNDTTARDLLDFLAKRCPHAKKLSIKAPDSAEHPWVNDEDLVAFATQKPDLRSLTLQGCSALTENGIIAALEKCSNLRHISIDSDTLTNETIETIIPNNPFLESLRITGRNELDHEALLAITAFQERLTHLKNIDFQIQHDPQHCPFNVTVASYFFTVMKGLQDITFHGCTYIHDDAVEQIVTSNGAGLKKLNLGGCTQITPRAIQILAADCPNLTSLTLLNAKNPDLLRKEVQTQIDSGFFTSLKTYTIE